MKKLLLIGAVLFVIGVAGLFLTGVISEEKTVVEEKIIDSEGVNAVEIKVDIGRVNIIESDSDDILVKYEGNVPTDSFKFAAERKGDQVDIAAHSKRTYFFIPFVNLKFNEKRTFDIVIPKKGLTKVAVNGDTARIIVDTENVKEFVATSDTGKIEIQKFHGEFMKLRTDVGGIVVTEASGEMDIRTDTGSIRLTMKEMRNDVHLESDVGSINVDMKQVPESLVLDIDSDIGKVTVKGLEGYESTAKSSLRYQKGEKGPVLRVKTDVGPITIESN